MASEVQSPPRWPTKEEVAWAWLDQREEVKRKVKSQTPPLRSSAPRRVNTLPSRFSITTTIAVAWLMLGDMSSYMLVLIHYPTVKEIRACACVCVSGYPVYVCSESFPREDPVLRIRNCSRCEMMISFAAPLDRRPLNMYLRRLLLSLRYTHCLYQWHGGEHRERKKVENGKRFILWSYFPLNFTRWILTRNLTSFWNAEKWRVLSHQLSEPHRGLTSTAGCQRGDRLMSVKMFKHLFMD